MPVPVYSISLLRAENLTGGVDAIAPAGFAWVLRDLDVVDSSELGGNLFKATITDLASVTTLVDVWTSPTGPGPSWHGWRGRQVLEEGWTLSLIAFAGLDVSASGYQLSLP